MILVAVIVLLAACVPSFRRGLKQRSLEHRLTIQLRQSLNLMIHGLRVGRSFFQALERAAQEGADPLAKEWKTTLQAIRMGLPITQAMTELHQRVPLKEMGWFVSAVHITQMTGGSLSGVLDTLAATLQEREKLRDKVSALTAQGKASGALLSALPFLMMAALYVIAPEFVTPFFKTSAGQVLLSAVIIGVATGGFVIFKIVSIRAE